MKKLIPVVVLIVVALLVVIGPTVERAVNDTVPPKNFSGGLVPVNVAQPPVPLGTNASTPEERANAVAKAAAAPLPKKLVTGAATTVRVPEGTVKISPGVNVELVRDRGAAVDVNLGGKVVELPRDVVAASAQPITEEPSFIRRTVMAPVEKLLYAPDACVSVMAYEIGTGKGIERNDPGSRWWIDSDRDAYRTKGLQVEVRNISRRDSGECQVTAYWIARNLADRRMSVHHAEALPATIASASSITLRFWCPLLPSNGTKTVWDRRPVMTGSKIDGWFVLVSRAGRTIGGYSTSPSYQQLLKNPAELEPLLASYVPSGRAATSEMPNWRKDPVRDEWRKRGGAYNP